MSQYRRLISYIYAYEGGAKGRSIGYAKIEVRGERCAIYINVKRVYVGSNDIGVYLLTPDAEIMLGKMFVRGGAGEFRIHVNAGNIENSGHSIGDCYGLTVHDVASTWQCYTTIWEDAVAQAAELELADVTAENVRKKEEAQREKNMESAQEGTGAEYMPESSPAERLPVSKEIEENLEWEARQLGDEVPWTEPQTEVMTEAQLEMQAEVPTGTAAEAPQATAQAAQMTEPPQEAEPVQAVEPVQEAEPAQEIEPVQAVEPVQETEPQQPTESQQPAEPPRAEEPCRPEPGDPARLAELDREEQEGIQSRLWHDLQRRYTKVLAFDCEHGCEILSIKPQDIGLLPRETWVYGNNSFLLHGYYNYRHLILARLENPGGRPRYLLGVPGHYFSNERHMATMFGFPHFVLARKQPQNDGRFGYWYTDVQL